MGNASTRGLILKNTEYMYASIMSIGIYDVSFFCLTLFDILPVCGCNIS